MTAGYSKRSLVEKLGIKPNSSVAILNAPTDFNQTLGPLPGGVVLESKPGKELDFIHAFFLNSKKLDLQFPSLKKALSETGALWISWPKMAAKLQTDLTENVVREVGLRVDEVWSGLKFVYRLKDRGGRKSQSD